MTHRANEVLSLKTGLILRLIENNVEAQIVSSWDSTLSENDFGGEDAVCTNRWTSLVTHTNVSITAYCSSDSSIEPILFKELHYFEVGLVLNLISPSSQLFIFTWCFLMSRAFEHSPATNQKIDDEWIPSEWRVNICCCSLLLHTADIINSLNHTSPGPP